MQPSTQHDEHHPSPRAGGDPVLSYAESAAELGISIATLRRRVLPYVAIVEITDRRRGLRRSVVEGVKVARTRQPGGDWAAAEK
jgi:hypothetical protein